MVRTLKKIFAVVSIGLTIILYQNCGKDLTSQMNEKASAMPSSDDEQSVPGNENDSTLPSSQSPEESVAPGSSPAAVASIEIVAKPPEFIQVGRAQVSYIIHNAALLDMTTLSCRLNGAIHSSCTSPIELNQLKSGKFNLEINVKTLNGDDIASSAAWEVELVPDFNVEITSGPEKISTNNSARIIFASNRPAASLVMTECRLNNVLQSSCGSPATFNNLVPGQYTFNILAKDNLGQSDSAMYAWEVKEMVVAESLESLSQKFLYRPAQFTIDSKGENAYIADLSSLNLVKINLVSGQRSVVVDGSSDFKNAAGFKVDASSGKIYYLRTSLITYDLNTKTKTVFAKNPVEGYGFAVDFINSAWQAGPNSLIYKTNLSDGVHSIISSSSLGSGPVITTPYSISVDVNETAAYLTALADKQSSIVKVNLASGQRTIIGSSTVGKGVALKFPRSLIVDKAHKFAYYTDTDAEAFYIINRINLTTLLRETVYSAKTDVLNTVKGIHTIKFGTNENEIYFTDNKNKSFLKFNTVTKTTSLIYRSHHGEGPGFVKPSCIVVNSSETLSYVVDQGAKSVLEVQLSTGDRKLISGENRGSGPVFQAPIDAYMLANDQKILVLDNVANQLMSVNVSTGERIVVSGSKMGTGPLLNGATDFVVTKAEDKAYVINNKGREIISINLVNGNRTSLGSTVLIKGASYDVDLVTSIALNSDETSLYLGWFANSVMGVYYGFYGTLHLETKVKSWYSSSYDGKGEFMRVAHSLSLGPDPKMVYAIAGLWGEQGTAAIFMVDTVTGQKYKRASGRLYDPIDFIKAKNSNNFYILDAGLGAVFRADPTVVTKWDSDIVSLP